MSLGQKIKEVRTKKGMTQKELADSLFVTYQAVSRWENGDAEPSLSTLKEMCNVLECDINELMEVESKPQPEPTPLETVVEKVIVQEAKPMIAICDKCKKAIYSTDDLHRRQESHRVKHGRTHHTEYETVVYCDACWKAMLEQERKAKEKALEEKKRIFKKKRVNSFIWPTLALVLSIVLFGAPGIIVGLLAFTMFACFILGNNFLSDMWVEVASWGFVKMPGVIFSFDLDGLKFFILMKLFLWLLGLALGLAATILATFLCAGLSVFVYPFALANNIKLKGDID